MAFSLKIEISNEKMLLFIWSPLGDSCLRLLNVTRCFLNPSERRSSEPARCPVEVCRAGSPRSASEMQVKWTLWVITIIIILGGGPAAVDSCHLGSDVISLKVFPVHSVWSCPPLPLQLQYRLSWSFSCVKLNGSQEYCRTLHQRACSFSIPPSPESCRRCTSQDSGGIPVWSLLQPNTDNSVCTWYLLKRYLPGGWRLSTTSLLLTLGIIENYAFVYYVG